MKLNLLIALFFLCNLLSATEIRQFDLETTQALGLQIFQNDMLGYIAGDVLAAAKDIDIKKEGISGWVITMRNDHALVRFPHQVDDHYESVADVLFYEGKEPELVKGPEENLLTENETLQLKARGLVYKIENIPVVAGDTYNPVVLDDPDGDGFLVYLLAYSMQPGTIIVGGHYRYTVNTNATEIEQGDQLFVNPMAFDLKEMSKNGEVSALTVSTLLSNIPLETHIYTSLFNRIPLAVLTKDYHIFMVEGANIKPLGKAPENGSPEEDSDE